MSRRALFTVVAALAVSAGAYAVVRSMGDQPSSASTPGTAARPTGPPRAGDGFQPATPTRTGPSLAAGTGAEGAPAPVGPHVKPEVLAKVDDLQAHGIAPAGKANAGTRLRAPIDWPTDPAVQEAARTRATEVLATSPTDVGALQTMVIVSCATGDKNAAGKFSSNLPPAAQSVVASQCKAHGVELPTGRTPDPRFNAPSANPQVPDKSRSTPSPK